jgi:hypothetical protein
VAGIGDGRLDGTELGDALVTLLALGVLKPTRLAPRLEAAASTSPLHVEVVRRALEGGLDLGDHPMPKNFHAVLQVFLDLTCQAGAEVTNAGTRRYLESIRGPSKSGKLAAGLLATRSLPRASGDATALALAARVARARRWTDAAAATGRHDLFRRQNTIAPWAMGTR